MYYIIIPIVALFASLLTFFSGFGLGTILTPVFALFFPIEIAIALTAIVHFLNNIFKLIVVGKNILFPVGIPFALFAIIGALAGAVTLNYLSALNLTIYQYSINHHSFSITLIKLIIGLLILGFTLIDFIPSSSLQSTSNNKWKNSFLGGILSGFFGGISGNQGAMRSAFLIKTEMSKLQYVATGTFIACCIDTTRLSVYFNRNAIEHITSNINLLVLTIVFAFSGVILGNRLLKKISLQVVRIIVTTLLVVISCLLLCGII